MLEKELQDLVRKIQLRKCEGQGIERMCLNDPFTTGGRGGWADPTSGLVTRTNG